MVDELLNGLADFKRYQYGDENALMPKLVEDGQDPKYFIISCIDSRCNPGTIFRARPGTFFAHKAMGAIVRPYRKGTALAAALQFALNYNGVEKVIVLGHTKCGAINALVNAIDDEEISEFISVAQHALDKAKTCCAHEDEIPAKTEQEVILESVENLKHYPSVAKALAEGHLTIKPWLFDMERGDLLEYNPDSDAFELLELKNQTERKDVRQNA